MDVLNLQAYVDCGCDIVSCFTAKDIQYCTQSLGHILQILCAIRPTKLYTIQVQTIWITWQRNRCRPLCTEELAGHLQCFICLFVMHRSLGSHPMFSLIAVDNELPPQPFELRGACVNNHASHVGRWWRQCCAR